MIEFIPASIDAKALVSQVLIGGDTSAVYALVDFIAESCTQDFDLIKEIVNYGDSALVIFETKMAMLIGVAGVKYYNPELFHNQFPNKVPF